MESFSLLKLKHDNIMYKAFLVEYDPQDYKLTKDDYYMAVSIENNRADIQVAVIHLNRRAISLMLLPENYSVRRAVKQL